MKSLSRRSFLRQASAGVAAVNVIPSAVLGLHGAPSPNQKLNVACIGVAGRGGTNISGMTRENIIALCDVDQKNLEAAAKKLPQARRFQDYRKLMDAVENQVDAVVVSTPDHTHAVCLMRAIKAGKHVYSEKPLAHSIHELRVLREAAARYKIQSQLGNQGHASESIRRFCQMIWSGTIGDVLEVHAFVGSNYSRISQLEKLNETQPIPATLDWDQWLGPALFRPFNSAYHPKTWRGWTPFGTGVTGDWTCHVIDPVFWALELGAPTHILAKPDGYDPIKHADTFPASNLITYEFAANRKRPAVKIFWYEGAKLPPIPPEMEDEKFPGIGALVIGNKGKILYGSHGAGSCRLLPVDKMADYRKIEKPCPVAKSTGHHEEWIAACKGGKPALSNFNYGAPLSEIALLGVIATRLPGQKLEWDAQAMQFKNSTAATAMVNPPYRKGWSL